MAKKYGPEDEFGDIKKIKLKKNDISNKMPMEEVEKRISELSEQIKFPKK